MSFGINPHSDIKIPERISNAFISYHTLTENARLFLKKIKLIYLLLDKDHR